MLTGFKSSFQPSAAMAEILSQWIGCARVIYNAKCDEDAYLRKFAAKYLPVGTYPELDKVTSRYKDAELTPWLSECPSQILRNSATIWHRTYQRFFKGLGGRPKRKTKAKGNYIWLTQELFRIRKAPGAWVVELGTKARPIGEVRIPHRPGRMPATEPRSIWIRRTAHRWYLSFSYEDGHVLEDIDNAEHLKHLSTLEDSELEAMITPVDRGVAKPLHTHNAVYTLTAHEKGRLAQREIKLKRYQRRLARQQKGSHRRKRTIQTISRLHAKTANVRTNFWHQTTRALVDNSQVIVIEDLKLKNMTRRPRAKQDAKGQWAKNGARAKSGLNKAILNVALGQFEVLLRYKMQRACKPLFKVSPRHTSQECAHCGYTHPDNRVTQADFHCGACGHRNNADHNAALVIRKRAIALIKHSGTELAGTDKNVLQPGTNAKSRKTSSAKARGRGDLFVKKESGLAPAGSSVL